MKIHPIGILGLLSLCVFQGATALPKYAGAKADWTQYMQGKRAALPNEEDSALNAPETLPPQQLPLKSALNPMFPYLSLRPVLPVKPTFMPPFVDPQMFVDKKAAFLSNLFGAGASGTVTSPSNTTAGAQPMMWLPATSPNYFAQKKTDFLKTLFASLPAQSFAPASPQEAKRDLPGSEPSPDSTVPAVTSNPFTEKKNDFLEKLFAALVKVDDDDNAEEMPVTSKPTIVPPSFWIPSLSSPTTLPRVPLAKTSPVLVDPNYFIDKKTKFLDTLFSNIAVSPKVSGTSPTKTSIVPPNYWIPPSKPTTATVYQQKVSEFLDKLFKSLNSSSDPVSVKKRDVDSLVSKDDIASEDVHSIKTRFIGSPMGMWGPSAFAPPVSPKFFIDKKNAFLSKLFTSLATPATDEVADPMDYPPAYTKPTIVPPNFWSPFPSGGVESSPAVKPTIVPPNFWSPFPSGGVASSPAVKPTIVPPNFWSPFAPSIAGNNIDSDSIPSVEKQTPVSDPSVFIDSKTKFLEKLFDILGLPLKSNGTDEAQTQTTTTTALPETVKTNDTDNLLLLESLGQILTGGPADSDSKRNVQHEEEKTELKDLSSEEISGDADGLSRRGVAVQSPDVSNPLQAAKDKVVNSIITELGGIKNEMMTTVGEILSQKKEIAEQAAAISPFPKFGMKSPFAFGGGKMFGSGMKGSGMKGTGKKGDTASTGGSKKKMGAPFGASKFPYWAPTPPTKPTPDPTVPLQERLEFLNQVFEMLTKLQEDVSSAVNEAASQSTPQVAAPPAQEQPDVMSVIQQLMAQDNAPAKKSKGKLVSRELLSQPVVLPVTPNPLPPIVNSKNEEESKTRSIKMAVHQGYQSLPPGTEEIIETGGGSEVDDHEGGGLKLQYDDYSEYQLDRQRLGHHHHRDRH